MNQQEQAIWLGLFTTTLNGVREMGPAEAAKTADAGLEEFRARVPPRRSLWARLFGGKRKSTDRVYEMTFTLWPGPGKSDEPEKTFRVVCDGHTSAAGSLAECRTGLASIRAHERNAALQMSTDCGRTWVEVSDDGKPLPPPEPVEEPKCAFVREPERAADPALSPPPPPADATEDSTPEANA